MLPTISFASTWRAPSPRRGRSAHPDGDVRRPLSAWAISLACLGTIAGVALGCSGTGSGGTGDDPTTPHPALLGRGDRLNELIGPADDWFAPDDKLSAQCKNIPRDRDVFVTGVTIVAIDDFDETGSGSRGNFYVEDTIGDPPPFSGMTVFDPAFSPPDLRLATSDVIDMSGVLTEFIGPSSGAFGYCKTLPEVNATLNLRFESEEIAPKTIPLKDLSNYLTARPWLGMLVRVEDVTISSDAVNNKGRFEAPIDVGQASLPDVPKISNELFDLESAGLDLTGGAHYAAVTGVVTFFYGFKLAPRSAEDFEP